MGHLIDQERDDKRRDNHEHPTHTTQHIRGLVAQPACRLVDMGHKEAHHRGHKVPRQIDSCQESNGLDGNLVGEQQFDILHDATLVLGFSRRKLGTLLQLSLQVPGDERHDKERSKHHTR